MCANASLYLFARARAVRDCIKVENKTVVFTSQHSGLVEQAAGALHTLSAALLSTAAASSIAAPLYHGDFVKDIETSRARAIAERAQQDVEEDGAEESGARDGGARAGRGAAGQLDVARVAAHEGDGERGRCEMLPRTWLREILDKVSDDAFAISRRSSQLSMVIGALLSADAGMELYHEALPSLLAAARAPESVFVAGGEGADAGEGGKRLDGIAMRSVAASDVDVAVGGETSAGAETTRVRALMALRYLLLNHQSGEKVIRISGDHVLCCILAALQVSPKP